jgi:hypothetical protein
VTSGPNRHVSQWWARTASLPVQTIATRSAPISWRCWRVAVWNCGRRDATGCQQPLSVSERRSRAAVCRRMSQQTSDSIRTRVVLNRLLVALISLLPSLCLPSSSLYRYLFLLSLTLLFPSLFILFSFHTRDNIIIGTHFGLSLAALNKGVIRQQLWIALTFLHSTISNFLPNIIEYQWSPLFSIIIKWFFLPPEFRGIHI